MQDSSVASVGRMEWFGTPPLTPYDRLASGELLLISVMLYSPT